MEDVVHAWHCIHNGLWISHIADVEFYFFNALRMFCLKLMAHVVLLLLVTGENTNFFEVGIKEMLKDSGAEGTCSACDH